MSIATAWQCLSVTEFIEKCNWEDIPLNLSAQTVSQYQSLVAWQCLTTQDFFCRNNWLGQINVDAPEHQELNRVDIIFDLTLPAARFWQCFNWSGQPHQPSADNRDRAIAEAAELIDTAEEFTLNDLSQLF